MKKELIECFIRGWQGPAVPGELYFCFEGCPVPIASSDLESYGAFGDEMGSLGDFTDAAYAVPVKAVEILRGVKSLQDPYLQEAAQMALRYLEAGNAGLTFVAGTLEDELGCEEVDALVAKKLFADYPDPRAAYDLARVVRLLRGQKDLE